MSQKEQKEIDETFDSRVDDAIQALKGMIHANNNRKNRAVRHGELHVPKAI